VFRCKEYFLSMRMFSSISNLLKPNLWLIPLLYVFSSFHHLSLSFYVHLFNTAALWCRHAKAYLFLPICLFVFLVDKFVPLLIHRLLALSFLSFLPIPHFWLKKCVLQQDLLTTTQPLWTMQPPRFTNIATSRRTPLLDLSTKNCL